jgi:hypothetical protein
METGMETTPERLVEQREALTRLRETRHTMTAAKYRQPMLEAGLLSALVDEDGLHLAKS